MDREIINIYNSILENIPEKFYNDMYYKQGKDTIDFSDIVDVENFVKITSYITVEITNDNENYYINVDLCYNDSKIYKWLDKIYSLDFDYVRLKNKINWLIFDLIVNMYNNEY